MQFGISVLTGESSIHQEWISLQLIFPGLPLAAATLPLPAITSQGIREGDNPGY